MRPMMTIDGIPVEIHDERNTLELIRKVGIELPTFCYLSELSIHGACRMCLVENDRGGLEAACSEPPKAGAKIWTNTKRLRKYRKNILELLLANHNRDCTVCANNGKCKLQDLALRFNIDNVRFKNTAITPELDKSSPCVTVDRSKCILCGDCVRVCDEVQGIGAIDFVGRGSKMKVSAAFGDPLGESSCVGCGQCSAVCPTGAIVVKNSIEAVWRDLDDKRAETSVQIAPAVRVALGSELGLTDGTSSMGLIVAALRRMGFAKIYDTTLGADLTVIEESREFLEYLELYPGQPMFTSCCPAWIIFCENNYPEFMPNLSTCRSPMQMLASLIKAGADPHGLRQVHVAVMPCTAKKYEASRREFVEDGSPKVDHVLTTQELIQMIKESGIALDRLEPEAVDSPFGVVTGAGVIFGVTGGVTEAVLRALSDERSIAGLNLLASAGERGMEGLKEFSVDYRGRKVNLAVLSGLANAHKLMAAIKSGQKRLDLVEVMACPGGCVAGAGQPSANLFTKEARGRGLYAEDKMSAIKRSGENPLIEGLYANVIKGRTAQLLHVTYPGGRSHDDHRPNHETANGLDTANEYAPKALAN
ncbi:MAG: [FeFe] hydrogenase, group A [Deltaproteobacteria bacterium]|jgi:NADH-quinone oxidoreductase subunit G|nr:[FeFe] hydrogenase, group A [Deltaproteobacteria bacterium]